MPEDPLTEINLTLEDLERLLILLFYSNCNHRNECIEDLAEALGVEVHNGDDE